MLFTNIIIHSDYCIILPRYILGQENNIFLCMYLMSYDINEGTAVLFTKHNKQL